MKTHYHNTERVTAWYCCKHWYMSKWVNLHSGIPFQITALGQSEVRPSAHSKKCRCNSHNHTGFVYKRNGTQGLTGGFKSESEHCTLFSHSIWVNVIHCACRTSPFNCCWQFDSSDHVGLMQISWKYFGLVAAMEWRRSGGAASSLGLFTAQASYL